ncbi:hypothetical protein V6N12_007539 [Hibiscus sabdariffa]|uniref:F-box associated beta-propeller type 3 domain-containing protein n=1 Tax=Hibiscus sabdariffa TaxID=183260 RepID=A0ABR2F217_9ROSI
MVSLADTGHQLPPLVPLSAVVSVLVMRPNKADSIGISTAIPSVMQSSSSTFSRASLNIFADIKAGLQSLANPHSRSIPHYEGKVISKKLPTSTTPMHLVDSYNGLLCMHDNSRNIYVCNPFTGLYVQLPKLVQHPSKVRHLGFGFHPTIKEYKVIQIVFRRKLRRDHPNEEPSALIQSEVQILTIGNPMEKFRNHTLSF